MSRVLSTMLCVSLLMTACGIGEFGEAQYDRPKNQPSVVADQDDVGSYGGASSDESLPVGVAGFDAGGSPSSDPVVDAGSAAAGDTHVILL